MSSVDVVVPCYNYAHYLEHCVRSVLSQREVDVRVLILDDASPDDTPQVGRQLAEADPRIIYRRNEKNLGLIGTANRGVMEWASAEYVVLLSADDALTPGSLARATRLMDAEPEIPLAYGMALMLHDDGPKLDVDDVHDAPTAVLSGKAFIQKIFAQGNVVPTPCAVLRTSVQHRIGGYRERFKHTSDVDMWLRAATAGPVGVIGAVQGFYRWHASNMSAAYHVRPIGDRTELLATCEAFLAEHGGSFAECARWLHQMKRRFGTETLLIASKRYERPDGAASWRQALQFAKKMRKDYWLSPIWWKFLAKRQLGRRLTARIQGLGDGLGLRAKCGSMNQNWYDHGARIGWWPDGIAEASSGRYAH